MKLLRFGEKGKEKPGILDQNKKIRDLSGHIDDFDSKNINFANLEKIKKIDLNSLPIIDSSTRIGSCIATPGKFLAVGLNFSDHAKEVKSNLPKEPMIFSKATSCIIGPYDDIVIPRNSTQLDWEVEIAFVIGKEAKYVSLEHAEEYIFGYCLVDDVSERDWQKNRSGQFIKGKSGDTFGPIGPYLVTKEEIKDVNNLNMTTKVNGEIKQDGNTDKMIFSMNYILSYLSNFMSLQPGDIVTTGTPPGVGAGMNPPQFLKTGDVIELEIESLGTQKHNLVSEQ